MNRHTQLIFKFYVEIESRCVVQAGLKLLASSNPPCSASPNVGITGVSHCALLRVNCWIMGAVSSAPTPGVSFVSLVKIYSKCKKIPPSLSIKRLTGLSNYLKIFTNRPDVVACAYNPSTSGGRGGWII